MLDMVDYIFFGSKNTCNKVSLEEKLQLAEKKRLRVTIRWRIRITIRALGWKKKTSCMYQVHPVVQLDLVWFIVKKKLF